MPTIKRLSGFTLIEIIVVLAVIAILMTMAMPNTTNRVAQMHVKESVELIEPFKKQLSDYYRFNGKFPGNNKAAGIPEPDKIMGNYVTSVELIDGALHLTLGHKAHKQLQGKLLSIRPIYVAGSPGSPISWVCGFDEVPKAMQVSGDNLTNMEALQLPINCR